jgi:hypothetical protein
MKVMEIDDVVMYSCLALENPCVDSVRGTEMKYYHPLFLINYMRSIEDTLQRLCGLEIEPYL